MGFSRKLWLLHGINFFDINVLQEYSINRL